MDRDAYLSLHAHEELHWWFVARRRIIKKVLNYYFAGKKLNGILEVGCGSGGNLELLSCFGKVHAMEMDAYCVEMANTRKICHVKSGSLPDDVPFTEKFELICMFDVLEHVDEDVKALKAISERLSDDGILFVTVPAYGFLWSNHDVVLNHKRRYMKRQLLDVFAKAGMRPVYSTYFNTFLMPLVLLVRAYNKLTGKSKGDDNKLSPKAVNNLLNKVFSSERFIIPGMSMPFGVSILIVAKKNNEK